MCGRFNVIDNPGLQALLRDLGVDIKLPPGINLAPTDAVPLVRETGEQRAVEAARWWLTPSWAPRVEQKYAMFNARCETLASSKAWRHPFRQQRGIMPMSSFIEWRTQNGSKQPWLISSPGRALAAAALWDVWEGEEGCLLSCSMVTTAAAEAFTPWHHRMPVLLEGEECDRWLDNSQPLGADDNLFRSELKFAWQLEPLSTAINRSGRHEPQLLDSVGEAVVLEAAAS
ncbi:SOS response-associated peptidase [Parahaliea maris]|uniref:Abasic site processing protein n=1 Tax=Parahaliea maris TaxID=2716870 RepID=A0A5C8ZWJ3_9GAMM|nr:SOS response-associated peptidase [Parahaliea maris]TXS92124.1 SOS response-associated peptidase [Parahaliea maris]